MQKKIHIGTSGWSYKHWRGTFYPQEIKIKDHFNYYTRHFNTVEINNTFYGLPSPETFLKWNNTVNDDFLFVIKANRYITHIKKLSNASESMTLFMERIKLLGKKLGPVLFQLPPTFKPISKF